MPGILPMKVIKVGTSTQSRIAQACDRCRSKKIRCDGVRPTCSQCANVGFECRTSDKLSRRAFPRGYTESLEERVRALETEIRELKDLLDEKDEKIDMLSKMHGYRPQPHRTTSNGLSPADPKRALDSPPREDIFRVQASPLILDTENSDSYFMGASSGFAFIEPLKRKLQETGRHCSLLNPEYFFHIQGCKPLVEDPAAHVKEMPPRLLADRAVNVFFQEWAPVFPVLHKPTFLQLYEEYVANPSKIKDSHKLATLYLVFSIAGLSGESPILGEVAACEYQWQPALENVIMQNTMNTLQCLILAIIYSMMRADYKRLQHYKAVAIGLSHRLGLHQSQKRFSFGALTLETRKRAFWTLHSLDCISAAMIGLPKMLKEEDIECEMPSDTDDEYITEKGYQPTLPGEYTRISSALALFRLSRILARVLEKVYPGSASHDLSLQLLWSLDGELSEWSENLPSHLRLNFCQDKPSTDVTGARSPILALAYYYVRALIHRPTVGTNLGAKAVPSLIALGESCKHIVQICELLEERRMSFTFCLNKNDLLVFCAMVLLYQSIELKGESKLLKDVERLVYTVIRTLERRRAPESPQIEKLSAAIIPNRQESETATSSENSQSPSSTMSPPSIKSPASVASSTVKQSRPLEDHTAGAPTVENGLLKQGRIRRRSSSQIPTTAGPRPQSRASADQPPSEQGSRRDGRSSFSHVQQSMMRRVWPNVDYLPFTSSPTNPQPTSPLDQHNMTSQPAPPAQQMYHSPQVPDKTLNNGNPQIAEWETLIGSMDNGAMHNAIYGGHNHHMGEQAPTSAVSTATFASWSPDTWDLANFNLGELNNPNSTAHSVPSISDESLSSGEDLTSSDMYANLGGSEESQANMVQSQAPRTSQDGGNELYLDGLDLGFPLNLQC